MLMSRLTIIYEAFKSMYPSQSKSTFGQLFMKLQQANIAILQKSLKKYIHTRAFIVHARTPGHHFVCFRNKNHVSC